MEAGRAEPREPYLHSLDLLRGFAAMSVCFYHTAFMLAPGHNILPGGYLCVDLFFLLSGFVIARTYDRRIEHGMTLGAFCVQRLARLYPLFLATTLLGFIAVNGILYEQFHAYGGGRELLTLAGNLLLIPNVLRPYDIGSMFPFNGAAWSIFFEFYVNVLFFLCWQYLTLQRIAAAIALSAVLVAYTAARAHSLDIGSQSVDLVPTIPRVLFSFFLGVLISRLGFGRSAGQFGMWSSLFGLGTILAALSLRVWLPRSSAWIADVAVVTLVFPAVLLAFTQMRFPARYALVSSFLGNISYAVYLLQTPLMVFFSAIPRVLAHEQIAKFAPWAEMIFIPALMTSAFLVWKHFEVPAKRAVRRWHAAASGVLGEAA
jgi:peptidoglycan/LPS O-acetylase OafA/YrhL